MLFEPGSSPIAPATAAAPVKEKKKREPKIDPATGAVVKRAYNRKPKPTEAPAEVPVPTEAPAEVPEEPVSPPAPVKEKKSKKDPKIDPETGLPIKRKYNRKPKQPEPDIDELIGQMKNVHISPPPVVQEVVPIPSLKILNNTGYDAYVELPFSPKPVVPPAPVKKAEKKQKEPKIDPETGLPIKRKYNRKPKQPEPEVDDLINRLENVHISPPPKKFSLKVPPEEEQEQQEEHSEDLVEFVDFEEEEQVVEEHSEDENNYLTPRLEEEETNTLRFALHTPIHVNEKYLHEFINSMENKRFLTIVDLFNGEEEIKFLNITGPYDENLKCFPCEFVKTIKNYKDNVLVNIQPDWTEIISNDFIYDKYIYGLVPYNSNVKYSYDNVL